MEKNEINTNDVNNKPQFAIFDWIVSLPVIRIVKPLYEWKKAFWIYCFLGFISTVSNYIFAIVLADTFGIMGSIANVIAWLLSTFISFVLFRYFYFDRTNNSFFNELVKFASARIFTLGFETLSIFIFVDLLHIDIKIVKLVLIPITAILNYFISKIFVFKNKEEKETT
ncbi:MAG: GtrA family protein [Erysipelotrichaceae bacterium]|nr:GtrA family protein [Erysipelotrichaceae bacterium]